MEIKINFKDVDVNVEQVEIIRKVMSDLFFSDLILNLKNKKKELMITLKDNDKKE